MLELGHQIADSGHDGLWEVALEMERVSQGVDGSIWGRRGFRFEFSIRLSS